MSDSILQKFLAEKNTSFVPTPHHGLQSDTKYKAALMLALLTISPAKVGEKLNVPAQIIRVWSKQPAVVRQAKLFQQEFTERVMAVLERDNIGFVYYDLADRYIYSEGVLECIQEYTEKAGNRNLTSIVVELFGTSTVQRIQDRFTVISQLSSAKEILLSERCRKLSQEEWNNLRGTTQRAIKHILEGGL